MLAARGGVTQFRRIQSAEKPINPRLSARSQIGLKACITSHRSTTMWHYVHTGGGVHLHQDFRKIEDIPLAALPLDEDGRRDSYWAGGFSAGLHLLALLWTLIATPSLPVGSSARGTTAGSLSISFLSEAEFRQPVVIVQTGTRRQTERASTTPELPAVERLPDPLPDRQTVTVATAVTDFSVAPPSARSPRTGSTTEPSDTGAGAPVEHFEALPPALPPYSREHDYLVALREAVRAHWAPGTGPCSITIQQRVGGRIIAAVSESCAMAADAKQALEAAALSAQPLPYAGFERVFRERVTLNMSL
jgi:hypothetical protein